MWRTRIIFSGIIIIFLALGFFIAWIFFNNGVYNQSQIALIIAALSFVVSAIGVLGSWIVIIEMQNDREAIYKPQIYADFDTEGTTFSFYVINNGQNSAKKVQVNIDPLPLSSNNKPINDVLWLQKPIETLLPGKKYIREIGPDTIIFSHGNPRRYSITIKYQSLTGKRYIEGPYTINLDEYQYSKIISPTIETSLKNIDQDLQSLTRLQNNSTRYTRS